MVRTGAVVINVGINRLDDGRLVDDVKFESVAAKSVLYHASVGRVGSMTVSMLLVNTNRVLQTMAATDLCPDLDKAFARGGH
jgi:methylenetetrahydrofolate dehydrogenase (NADP+)/methenyltetrahydrofolate cyclohydrolase